MLNFIQFLFFLQNLQGKFEADKDQKLNNRRRKEKATLRTLADNINNLQMKELPNQEENSLADNEHC